MISLSFDQTDIDWPAVEKQLLTWGDLFRTGKKLTLNISFNFVENNHGSKFGLKATDKRGASSVTQRMLIERDAEINDDEEATGQPPPWTNVYSLMRCSGRACELGPHCWRDPISKKHIKLTVQNLRALVNFVEQGGVLTSHDDVPDSIREKLYIQEQQRIERHKRSHQTTAGYPPINITNVLPAQSLSASVPDTPIPASAMSPAKITAECLDIPGLRDLAVAEIATGNNPM
ncbi:hypothetical protein ACN42_g2346 [Penicillium freii]|uniref:Uncharacterized protein n=1 Tax=Penicillium freii TaxID=48697 RepID=A0A101MQB9_PENFR|nr:hypothetical protein ACN42_g2346 [Penicillium freii]